MSLNRKDLTTAAKGVELQHRHFAFIAATLNKANTLYENDREAWIHLCELFASQCNTSNPRFNRSRFLSACGVED